MRGIIILLAAFASAAPVDLPVAPLLKQLNASGVLPAGILKREPQMPEALLDEEDEATLVGLTQKIVPGNDALVDTLHSTGAAARLIPRDDDALPLPAGLVPEEGQPTVSDTVMDGVHDVESVPTDLTSDDPNEFSTTETVKEEVHNVEAVVPADLPTEDVLPSDTPLDQALERRADIVDESKEVADDFKIPELGSAEGLLETRNGHDTAHVQEKRNGFSFKDIIKLVGDVSSLTSHDTRSVARNALDVKNKRMDEIKLPLSGEIVDPILKELKPATLINEGLKSLTPS